MNVLEIEVKNKYGMHARPAADLALLASKFAADINVALGSRVVNGKSVIGIMTLGANAGQKLIVSAAGSDADVAISSIKDFIENDASE